MTAPKTNFRYAPGQWRSAPLQEGPPCQYGCGDVRGESPLLPEPSVSRFTVLAGAMPEDFTFHRLVFTTEGCVPNVTSFPDKVSSRVMIEGSCTHTQPSAVLQCRYTLFRRQETVFEHLAVHFDGNERHFRFPSTSTVGTSFFSSSSATHFVSVAIDRDPRFPLLETAPRATPADDSVISYFSSCNDWSCTCQGFSNMFGTGPGRWGSAKGDSDATSFWVSHKCSTRPTAELVDVGHGIHDAIRNLRSTASAFIPPPLPSEIHPTVCFEVAYGDTKTGLPPPRFQSTFRAGPSERDLGPLLILVCGSRLDSYVDDNDVLSYLFWREHFNATVLHYDRAPSVLPARTVVVLPPIDALSSCQSHHLIRTATAARKFARHEPPTRGSVGWSASLHLPDKITSLRVAGTVGDNGRNRGDGTRPLLLDTDGPGSGRVSDVVMLPSRATVPNDAVGLHYLAGVYQAHGLAFLRDGLPERSVYNSLRAGRRRGDASPRLFCHLQTESTLPPLRHTAGSLAGWAMFVLLNEHRMCHYTGGMGWLGRDHVSTPDEYNATASSLIGTIKPITAAQFPGPCPVPARGRRDACAAQYRFTIVVEDAVESGRIGAGVFAAANAGSVPIYIGAPDARNVLNPSAFVHCVISPHTITNLQSQIVGGNHNETEFLFGSFMHGGKQASIAEVIAHAVTLFRGDLQPCVNRVLAADENIDSYDTMSTQPLVSNRDVLTGRATAVGLRDAFLALDG